MTLPSEDVQATFAATLVDEWARGGVTEAVIAPGSRSTPLALALAADGRLRVHVRLDERSAGFFALGIGAVSGRPAVVLTTSGTAAVELHPAVVEAHQAGVPLLVCTADRPPELHHVGAPQTVEQDHLFLGAVRWASSPGVADWAARHSWRSLGARAVWEATSGRGGPGPVHLNLAFREPLVGSPRPLPAGRDDGGPWHGVVQRAGLSGAGTYGAPGLSGGGPAGGLGVGLGGGLGVGPGGGLGVGPAGGLGVGPGGAAGLESVGARLSPARRGVIIAGAGCGPPGDVLALGRRLGWPVLADPRSGCRIEDRWVVAAADAFLRDAGVATTLAPDVVVRIGAPWASKVLASWLAGLPAEQILLDPYGRWLDPDRTASSVLACQVRALLDLLDPGGHEGPAEATTWSTAWTLAEEAAQHAIDKVLDGQPGLCEPAIARGIYRSTPSGGAIVASSSMPVRDLEWYGRSRAMPPVVLSNRGANGIDGVVSTVMGVAAAHSGPTIGLVGDLAFLHDAGSLLGAASGPACTLVVVDNDGGGIFSFLPQAGQLPPDRFELLFGTPHGIDLAAIGRAYSLPVTEPTTTVELASAVHGAASSEDHGLRLVIARTDRGGNVRVHEDIHRAVASQVADALR